MGGNDTIGRHLNPRLDDGVIGIAEVAVHRIDRLLALGDARTEPADIGVDAQAIDRLELRRQLGVPHLRIEILVDRRAITNLRDLLIAVIIERSEEHTSELKSLMRISYAVFR